jgi:metal-responsive CopG/Arc/MetJ family transcriptional regulator
MRTIQLTLDDEMVETVDQVVKELKTTRSAFVRKALKEALKQVNIKMLENQHKKGYRQRPAAKTEFSVWEKERVGL